MSRKEQNYPKVTILDVLREFFAVAKVYWFRYVLVIIAVIIAVVATGIMAPVYYKDFFDALASGTDSVSTVPVLIKIIAIILVLHFISWVGWRITAFASAFVQANTMNGLRQRAYEYVIGHSYAYFTNTFSGSLVQRINRFMRSFERVTDRLFFEIVPILTKVIGIFIVLYSVRPFFAYAIIVWMFFFLGMALIFTRWKIPYDIKAAEEESRASAVLADSLSNHATIQLFDRFEHEANLFRLANHNHTKAIKNKWYMMSFVESIQAFLNIIIEFVIFYVAIKYWGQGLMTVGLFVLVQTYIIGLMDNFWSYSRILRDLYESFADAKEMVEILKLNHGIKDSLHAKTLSVREGAIRFEEVNFEFNPGKSVIDNLELSIKPGEKVALIGPSGAGKSTLVRLLLRLYEIQKGTIKIDDQDIKEVTQGSLRQAISFVPQDPILFHRTLRDNIAYGRPSATEEEIVAAAKAAHCHEFISQLPQAYETFVGERGIKLSGGERQRVAIARAILKNAPILILDEATSSLDSHSEVLIQEALDNLMKGKTVMVIAHRLSTIRKMDRIVVLEGGKIVEEGSHEELIAKEGGLYAKLWSLQSHGFLKEEE